MTKSELRQKTCCFTGHRKIFDDDIEKIKFRLKITVKELINNGVIFFGFGGSTGFDLISAKAVLEMKEVYPFIKLILVQPCSNQTLYWKPQDIETYNVIKSKCDKVRCLSPQYYTGCMQIRNKHLVDNSSVCVSYLRKNSGGTFFTVNYARSQKLKIYNLADDTLF